MKHWLVFAALSLTTLLVSCGPTKAECEASTCNGCCDASGTCQVGNSNFSCGSAGAQCMQCNFGNVCLGGQCLPSSVSGGGSGSTGGGAGSTGGGAATGGGAGSTGGGAGSTGGGAGSTGGGSATGGGAGSTGGGSGATGGGAGSTGGGAGTGGGTALPSFTSQLWYYGTISTTARRDVGRVLFPSQTPFPLNVPGSDIRSFHVNATGRMVAVSADVVQAGRFDLVTLNHDGTNVRTLYQSPAGSNVSYVRFSPNGQRISFEVRDTLGNGQVFVVPVSGGTHVNVTPPKNTPGDPTLSIINSTWSRDSRYLAIVAETTYDRLNELFLVDMNSPSPTPTPILTASTMGLPGTGTSFWGVTSPVQWPSASRNEMLFKYRTSANVAFRLMRIGTDGTGLAPVPGTPDGVTTTGYVGSFGIGDDGVTTFFTADTITQQAYELYKVTLGTSSTTQVTTGFAQTGRRPDFNRAIESNSTSTYFAFGSNWATTSSTGASYEPWAVSANGTPVQLATFPQTSAYVDDLMWSPSGTQLAMVSDYRSDELFEVFLLPSLTSNSTPQPLVTPVAGGRVIDSTWTP